MQETYCRGLVFGLVITNVEGFQDYNKIFALGSV